MELLFLIFSGLAAYACRCMAESMPPNSKAPFGESVPFMVPFGELDNNRYTEFKVDVFTGLLFGSPYLPYLSYNEIQWKGYDTGNKTENGNKLYKIFLLGKDWWNEGKTCWQKASDCLNNNWSDKTNSITVQATSQTSFSTSKAVTVGGQFSVCFKAVTGSLSVSHTYTRTWTETVSSSQSVTCNVGPHDTVQVLEQFPFTIVEGYFFDVECWKNDDNDGSLTCHVQVDKNRMAYAMYGNMKFPRNVPGKISVSCVSKNKLAEIDGKLKLPCESDEDEICMNQPEKDLRDAFKSPKELGVMKLSELGKGLEN